MLILVLTKVQQRPSQAVGVVVEVWPPPLLQASDAVIAALKAMDAKLLPLVAGVPATDIDPPNAA